MIISATIWLCYVSTQPNPTLWEYAVLVRPETVAERKFVRESCDKLDERFMTFL